MPRRRTSQIVPALRRGLRLARAYPRRAVIAGIGLVAAIAFFLSSSVVDDLKDANGYARIDRFSPLIREHAQRSGLPEDLVRSVVLAESGGRPEAVSPIGARGLMQVTAITEKDVLQRNPDLKPGDLHEPAYNLRVGTTYLAYLMDRFDGDLTLTLTAYHMGPTAVRRVQRKHPGISPDRLLDDHAGPQTRYYVRRVLREYEG